MSHGFLLFSTWFFCFHNKLCYEQQRGKKTLLSLTLICYCHLVGMAKIVRGSTFVRPWDTATWRFGWLTVLALALPRLVLQINLHSVSLVGRTLNVVCSSNAIFNYIFGCFCFLVCFELRQSCWLRQLRFGLQALSAGCFFAVCLSVFFASWRCLLCINILYEHWKFRTDCWSLLRVFSAFGYCARLISIVACTFLSAIVQDPCRMGVWLGWHICYNVTQVSQGQLRENRNLSSSIRAKAALIYVLSVPVHNVNKYLIGIRPNLVMCESTA